MVKKETHKTLDWRLMPRPSAMIQRSPAFIDEQFYHDNSDRLTHFVI